MKYVVSTARAGGFNEARHTRELDTFLNNRGLDLVVWVGRYADDTSSRVQTPPKFGNIGFQIRP